jgi:uncharacterized protein (TIGR03066 family)
MRTAAWPLAALCVIVFCAPALAEEKKFDAAKVIGKWTPKEQPKGTTKVVVEYKKGGKMTMVVEANGKKETVEGTYTVEGSKLTVDILGKTRVSEILKLTDDAFEFKIDTGAVTSLVRVKEK